MLIQVISPLATFLRTLSTCRHTRLLRWPSFTAVFFASGVTLVCHCGPVVDLNAFVVVGLFRIVIVRCYPLLLLLPPLPLPPPSLLPLPLSPPCPIEQRLLVKVRPL